MQGVRPGHAPLGDHGTEQAEGWGKGAPPCSSKPREDRPHPQLWGAPRPLWILQASAQTRAAEKPAHQAAPLIQVRVGQP